MAHLPIGTKIAASVLVQTRPSPRTRTPAEIQTSTILRVPSSSSNHCRKDHYDAVLWLSILAILMTIFGYRQCPGHKNVTLNLMTSSGASASNAIQRASSVLVRTKSTALSVSLYLPSPMTMMRMCLLLTRHPDDIAFPSTENNGTANRPEQINPRLMLHYPTQPIAKSSIRAGNRPTTSL